MTIHELERPKSKPSTVVAIGLRVDGKEYGGWKTARITRGIESIAGSFSLTASERWADGGWPVQEEDECVCVIGATKVLTGHVDRRSLEYSANEHSLTYDGRDK